MPPDFHGLGKVSERPVASQVRLRLRAAAAAASVQLRGAAGRHVQSGGLIRRRIHSAVVMVSEFGYGEFGFFLRFDRGERARVAGVLSTSPLSRIHEISITPGGMQPGMS